MKLYENQLIYSPLTVQFHVKFHSALFSLSCCYQVAARELRRYFLEN